MGRPTGVRLASILLYVACISGSLYSWDVVTRIPGIQAFRYKTTASRPLYLYTLQPSPALPGMHPAIVFFFGGGWVGGTTDQFADQAQYFALRGFVTVLADYRVKHKDNSTPFDSVRDARSAMRWLRKHAKELHIDGNRIVASGGSAGGHLAGATAILSGIDDLSDDLSVSPSPVALVLFNPVLDTTETGYGASQIGPSAKELSLTHHLSRNLPPTILFHGTNDHTVPFANAVEFTRVAKTYGADCELVPFTGADHGFFNSPNFRKTVTADTYQKILDDVDVFLKKQGLEQ
jgi:acetyl esterase/lipase